MQQLKERGIYTLPSEREELVAHAVFRDARQAQDRGSIFLKVTSVVEHLLEQNIMRTRRSSEICDLFFRTCQYGSKTIDCGLAISHIRFLELPHEQRNPWIPFRLS